GPILIWIRTLISGVPPIPTIPKWQILVSQRRAVADVLSETRSSLILVFLLLAILVVALHLIRSRPVALIGAAMVWVLLNFVINFNNWISSTMLAIVGIVVLLRLGILAYAVFDTTRLITLNVTTLSWSEWYGNSAMISAFTVIGILVYGLWAATSGQKLFGEET
ncbi:MAG: hypothetical protein GY906_22165, partial [bacterium]|nr:hypothetical protein [bacterium]